MAAVYPPPVPLRLILIEIISDITNINSLFYNSLLIYRCTYASHLSRQHWDSEEYDYFFYLVNDSLKIICWCEWTQLFYTRSNSVLQVKKDENIPYHSLKPLFISSVCVYMLFCSSNSLRVQTGYILGALLNLPVLRWFQRSFYLLIHKREARHHMYALLACSLAYACDFL